jgi:hypothetical protein
MSDNDRSSLGLLPGLAIGALTSNSAMPSRTEEPRATLSTHLVALGLVAAATIIIFGIASFSLLYTSEGVPRGSGIRDRGVEVKPVRSGVFPYTHANRPPLPAEAELPGPAAEATLSTSPPGSPAARDMQTPEVSRAQPVSEPLPLGASEGSAMPEASPSGTVAQPVCEPLPPGASEGSAMQDASLSGTVLTRPPEVIGAQPVSEQLPPGASEGSATQDASLSGTVMTRPPEVIGAQPVSEPLPPGASEGSATADASLIGTVPTPPIPAEKRDPVFREMHQSVNLGGDNAASHEKIPIKHMQQGQSHNHYFSTNAAFWRYRLRKECGPIKYPALHGDCVRSFKAQYPIRYAPSPREGEGLGIILARGAVCVFAAALPTTLPRNRLYVTRRPYPT